MTLNKIEEQAQRITAVICFVFIIPGVPASLREFYIVDTILF
jgi:hypothetical protein